MTRDNGQVISCVSRQVKTKAGISLHITAMTPGEQASIISKDMMDKSDQADVTTMAAPKDKEFMDGDVFVFVKDNNVCVCSTGIFDTTLQYYFYSLFNKANLPDQSTQFLKRSVADVEKFKFLQDHPIKSITLNASLYHASAHLTANTKRSRGVTGIIGRHVNAVFGKESDVTDDSLMVELTLKTDGRDKQHLKLGERKLEKFAIDLLKHQQKDDDFLIITKDGQKIGPDEIKVQKFSNITAKGKSVDKDETWKELLAFYNELCETGAIKI